MWRDRPVARALAVAAAACALLATACTDDGASTTDGSTTTSWPAGGAPVTSDAPAPPPGAEAEVRLTQIGATIARPTSIVATPDGNELLVSTQDGRVERIELVRSGGFVVPRPAAAPVLDLTDATEADTERGLLAVTLSPDGDVLVVDHTTPDGQLAVVAYPYRAGEPVDVGAARTLLQLDHPYTHNGGGMAWSAEGDLLVAVGALRADGVTGEPEQTPDGVVLRIPADVVHDPSAVPLAPTDDDLVARGLRNPWRISVDAATGALWIGDVGESATEEIDVVDEPGVGPVPNFGWPFLEGSRSFVEPAPDGVALRPPTMEIGHRDGACAVVGGHVYRGEAIPALRGAYVYGDFCDAHLWAVRPGSAAPVPVVLTAMDESAVSLGEGADGELYVVASGGGIYRVDPASSRAPDLIQRVGPDAPAPASTTTVAAGTSDAPQCRAVRAVKAFGAQDGTPAELARWVDDTRRTLDEVATQLGDPASRTIADLVALLDEFAAVAEQHGWRADAPELTRLVRLVAAERGRFASTVYATYLLENGRGGSACP